MFLSYTIIQLWTFKSVYQYDMILTFYGNIDRSGAEVNIFIVSQYHILKNFYDVTYCVLSMDRWTNQPAAVDS